MAHDLTEGRGRTILVFRSPPAIFSYMTGKLRGMSSAAIAERQLFAAALSGGRTPVGLYREIAGAHGAFDWERMHIFLVDERFVPPTDSRSNFAVIKSALLDGVPIPLKNVHPVPIEGADPQACGRRYEDEIRAFFGAGPGSVPRFDLVMLGMGEDGHTASLFPASGVLEEGARLVRAVAPAGGRTARITLTLPVINNARNVVFLITGAGKAEALRRLVDGGDTGLPAGRVAPHPGKLIFLCDKEAASLLRS